MSFNRELGNIGRTVVPTPTQWPSRSTFAEMRQLDRTAVGRSGRDAIDPGRQSGLQRAGRLAFAESLAKVKNTIHLGLHDDETSQLCDWHLSRSPLPRIVGRCADVRRDGQHRAAADRAAFRRPQRDRSPGDDSRRQRGHRRWRIRNRPPHVPSLKGQVVLRVEMEKGPGRRRWSREPLWRPKRGRGRRKGQTRSHGRR